MGKRKKKKGKEGEGAVRRALLVFDVLLDELLEQLA